MEKYLFFGAHPDDIERWAGGTVASLTAAGHEVHMVILTTGQRGTYGSPAVRRREFISAAKHLGAIPKVLDLMDGSIEASQENCIRLAKLIRKIRPNAVFAPYFKSSEHCLFGIHHHQDHSVCGELVQKAVSLATMSWIDKTPGYRVGNLLYYMLAPEVVPNLFFSIYNASMQIALEAVDLHVSQKEAFKGPGTLREYLLSQRTYFRQMGVRLPHHCQHAELFLMVQPVVADAETLFSKI